MKTLALTAAALALSVTGVPANGKHRTINNKNTPTYQVADQFSADYPDARNVRWKIISDYTEATADIQGKVRHIFYDRDDELVGTTENIAYAAIPKSSQKEIAKRYAGYQIVSTIKYIDNTYNPNNYLLDNGDEDDAVNYFVTVSNGQHGYMLHVNDFGNVSFFKELNR